MTSKEIRAFVAIDIPLEIRNKIKSIQNDLPEFTGKITEPRNLHLTLKFLGNISDKKIEETAKRLKKIKFSSFETEIDELGFFSPNFIKILWLHMANCNELQKKVDESLKGIFEPERRFMSHLTIARVKKIKNKKSFLEQFNKIKIQEIKFMVKNFKLKQSILGSKGPKYKTLEEYSLE